MRRISSSTCCRSFIVLVFLMLTAGAKEPGAAKREAEDAVLTGGRAVADPSASGGYRVGYFDSAGDAIEFQGVSAFDRLEIVFSLNRENLRQCSLYVDDRDLETIVFYPTGAWDRYDRKHYYIPGGGGAVRLQLDPDDQAANRQDTCAAIDYINLTTGVATSTKAHPGPDGRIVYAPWQDGDDDYFLHDFSRCGYGGGAERLPDPSDIPVRRTLSSPGPGVDARSMIQSAIDQVSVLPLDDRGFRGAVLLRAGRYEVSDTLMIRAGGVVLRGEGEGSQSDSNTILVLTATSQRTLIDVRGGGNWQQVGDRHAIIDAYLPTGARRFNVADASSFQVGDTVIVRHQSPQTWIDAIGMDQLDNPWQPGSKDLDFDRVITQIEGNKITVDAPLPNAFEPALDDGGLIWKYRYSSPGRIRNGGVEFLRGESVYASDTDEDHGWDCVKMADVEHAWVRNVVSVHFGYSCVTLDTGAKWITVTDSSCLDPKSQITGGRRYSFNMNKGQLNLVKRCHTRRGRHDFVNGSTVRGPNAFVDCAARIAYSDSGPHHRWSAGTLYDNVIVRSNAINMRNRGNSGTGHGWAGANQLAWNCSADSMNIQRPPTAQNWAIGCLTPNHSGDGYWENHNTPTFPTSFHAAQLSDRLNRAVPGLLVHEESSGTPLPILPTDPDSVISIHARVRVLDTADTGDYGFAVGVHDATDANHLLIRLNANTNQPVFQAEVRGDRVDERVSAPLSIDQCGGAIPYTLIATFQLGSVDTAVSYRIFREDVNGLVWSGEARLNAVPAANLDRVARRQETDAAGTIGDVRIHLGRAHRFRPVADSYVELRAPDTNHGNATVLRIKGVGSARRDVYLKFDVAGTTGAVYCARLKLKSLTLRGGLKAYRVSNTSWSETGITWNNKPAMQSILGHESAILPGDWVALNVSGHVTGAGTVSFGLRNDPDKDGSVFNLASRESDDPANAPILEVIADGVPIPAAPTAVSTPWRLY